MQLRIGLSRSGQERARNLWTATSDPEEDEYGLLRSSVPPVSDPVRDSSPPHHP